MSKTLLETLEFTYLYSSASYIALVYEIYQYQINKITYNKFQTNLEKIFNDSLYKLDNFPIIFKERKLQKLHNKIQLSIN